MDTLTFDVEDLNEITFEANIDDSNVDKNMLLMGEGSIKISFQMLIDVDEVTKKIVPRHYLKRAYNLERNDLPKRLQNLPIFLEETKPTLIFFISCYFILSPNECPDDQGIGIK